jgi:hypothetical protein
MPGFACLRRVAVVEGVAVFFPTRIVLLAFLRVLVFYAIIFLRPARC